jgi:hypothetical protein
VAAMKQIIYIIRFDVRKTIGYCRAVNVRFNEPGIALPSGFKPKILSHDRSRSRCATRY